jgi:hypothetical protein
VEARRAERAPDDRDDRRAPARAAPDREHRAGERLLPAGLGRLALGAISARDLPVVQGVVLFVAVTVVTLNFVVDLLYTVLDPRIRYE